MQLFIQENAIENVVCKMVALLFWPQCVDEEKVSHAGSGC